MKQWFVTILLLTVIPGFGFGIARLVQSLANPGADLPGIALLGYASIGTLGLGLSIPVLIVVGSLIAGTDRGRMAAVFRPLVRLTLVMLAITILLQGTIITCGAFAGEWFLLGRVHFILIGLIGFGAVAGCFVLIAAAFQMGRGLTMPVYGEVVDEQTAPGLHVVVDLVSKTLLARKPDNVIVGLEPNFFATSAEVYLVEPKQFLQGETLFVSTTLARLLSRDELTAVIGHELAHFRGEDTAYTLRFAPVYAGIGQAMDTLGVGGGVGVANVAQMPAMAVLSLLMQIFARKEATVSRDREHQADQAATELGDASHIVTALIKTSAAGLTWDLVRQDNINQLNQGRAYKNLGPALMDNACAFVVQLRTDSALQDIVKGIEQSHPTDSHPSLTERARALGVSIDDAFDKAGERVATYGLYGEPDGDDFTEIENRLTQLEHAQMVSIGAVHPPNEADQ